MLDVNIQKYLLATHHIASENDLGFLYFSCPFCGDRRGRGWIHADSLACGCWNDGCPAHPKLRGGALAFVAEREGLRSTSAAADFLLEYYPGKAAPIGRKPAVEVDWCKLPPCTAKTSSVIGREAVDFVKRQWNVPREKWHSFSLRVCTEGRFAWRVIIPVYWRGELVSFTARTFRNGEPKYLSAKVGVDAARGLNELVYNIDAVDDRSNVLVVEGPGDAMAVMARALRYVPVAIFGTSMSAQRVARLIDKHPRSITIALDSTALASSYRIAAGLQAWDAKVSVATWIGAKDCGGGGQLLVTAERPTLSDLLRAKLAS